MNDHIRNGRSKARQLQGAANQVVAFGKGDTHQLPAVSGVFYVVASQNLLNFPGDTLWQIAVADLLIGSGNHGDQFNIHLVAGVNGVGIVQEYAIFGDEHIHTNGRLILHHQIFDIHRLGEGDGVSACRDHLVCTGAVGPGDHRGVAEKLSRGSAGGLTGGAKSNVSVDGQILLRGFGGCNGGGRFLGQYGNAVKGQLGLERNGGIIYLLDIVCGDTAGDQVGHIGHDLSDLRIVGVAAVKGILTVIHVLASGCAGAHGQVHHIQGGTVAHLTAFKIAQSRQKRTVFVDIAVGKDDQPELGGRVRFGNAVQLFLCGVQRGAVCILSGCCLCPNGGDRVVQIGQIKAAGVIGVAHVGDIQLVLRIQQGGQRLSCVVGIDPAVTKHTGGVVVGYGNDLLGGFHLIPGICRDQRNHRQKHAKTKDQRKKAGCTFSHLQHSFIIMINNEYYITF